MLEALDVRTVEPYENRPYEWVSANATFAVDPAQPANGRIMDLDIAPRDADGKVRFDADVRLLRPTGPGNGRALVIVPNRGMLDLGPFGGGGGLPSLTSAAPASGDGLLLDQGWTLAWCGWQWDVRRGGPFLGLTAPVAEPGPGWLRLEFRPDTVLAEHPLSDSSPLFGFTDYPTANLADAEATLSVRTTPLGPAQLVPRDQWRFTEPAAFTVDGGFQPFHWYELIYRSTYAPVVGVGMLALRDFGASLKASHDHVFAYGVSQCGRLLREYLYNGLNLDEDERPVFDGVFAHIASARRGEFNIRYGQPSLTHPLTPGYAPPYDTTALLERQRAAGGVPKIIQTNSAWEYWRGDGALVHQDPQTGADRPEDPDARVHLIAGTDHLGALGAFKASLPVANPVQSLETSLIQRALLTQLVEWVCDGTEPTPSAVPRQADGTAVTREEVLAAFAENFPDAVLPDPVALPWTPALDPDVTGWPLVRGPAQVALVSAVDASGNEVAGIRLPAVATGVAAYTGWNPRKHVEGLPDVLYEMVGGRIGARSTPDVAALRSAAEALVAARFLLPGDLERAVAAALDE